MITFSDVPLFCDVAEVLQFQLKSSSTAKTGKIKIDINFNLIDFVIEDNLQIA